jgi:CheY-like chemotaxis protein
MGGGVMLIVADGGVGIDPEIQPRIFDPFFTTKDPGKGSGLGLATAYGIVKQSGGDIEVESAPGEGATFRISFPCVAEPLTTPPAQAVASATGPGSETVLLVEDQPSVRTLARLALEAQGYGVLEAPNAERALELGGDMLGTVDLILTDLTMPGMNGRELIERIRSQRPEVKALLVSGFSDDAALQHGDIGDRTSFLQKPFTPATLTRKVRELLDEPTET